jgi:zinc protease
MRLYRNVQLLLLLTLVAALCLAAAEQQVAPNQAQAQAQAQANTLALNQAMPVNPQITIGKFPNGLRYYIRANKLPEKRAELRLAVNAGSVLEDKDQIGLAHMVEHMAFNGTTHFPKQEIVNFMESIGMRFGPEVNAYTSFDETVYMLTIPTDKPEVMDKAFLILEDWAHNLTFNPAEIDKERGVIIEEWRLGRGAYARMNDKQFPILFKGARYADRLPIGTKESIETFKHNVLKRFYKDWYRPDLMAVVAVGDFDKNAVEGLIKQHFASIPASKTPRLRPSYNVPDHPDTLYTVATDKEATMTSISVYNKLPLKEQGTVGTYRQKIVDALASGMLARRLSDMTQKPDAPFVSAAANEGIFVRTKEAAMLMAIPKEGGIDRALEALLTEAARVARFGFTPTEFDRQKTARMRTYERYLAEKDKRESATLANELVRNFTNKETLPGPELEYALHQRFLPEITLDEVNKVGKEFTSDKSRVVMVSAPEKAGVAVPDAAKLAAVVKGAGAKDITAYVDTVANAVLLDKAPEPGKITKTTDKAAFGITEWDLSNGIKVVLKPTDYKQDEIVFRATSPGGTSLASDADFIAARTATSAMSVSGLGKFNAIDLRKVLTGKIAAAGALIGELEEGLSGSCSPKDLETMFQLIYLRFTAPRTDRDAFAAYQAQGKAILANQQASPDYAFSETLQSTLSQNHPRARVMTADMIDQMNLDKSLAFYKDRFADASDFTFVFVGSFDLQMMKPFVEQYLASLPALHRNETWKDVGIRPPKGVVEKGVKKGIEPQSQAAIVFTGPFQYDRDHRVAIRALGMVLDTKLREVMREDLSGTYGVSVSPGYTVIPRQEYTFSIRFGCNPQRTDELIKVMFQEIENLKKNGPTEKQVSDVREALLREFETNSKQNGYLLNQIYLRYQVPTDLGEFFGLGEYYKTLNAKMILDAALTYLNIDNYVKVILLPEKETATSAVKKDPDEMPCACQRPAA